MDDFHSQSGALHLKEGHEESDISIKGIILSGVLLVIGGIFSFVATYGLYRGFEWWEASHEPKLSPVEQQLQVERKAPSRSISTRNEEETRAQTEIHLERTFPGPRLQYDDVYDMDLFRKSEDDWLNTTGRDARGNIHIPIERAIDLLSKSGLPSVSGPFLPANAPANTPLPGESAQPRSTRQSRSAGGTGSH